MTLFTRLLVALPAAIPTIFQATGVAVDDPATERSFRELDLLAAVDHVFENAR